MPSLLHPPPYAVEVERTFSTTGVSNSKLGTNMNDGTIEDTLLSLQSHHVQEDPDVKNTET